MMGNILICTIGNRDVAISNQECLLPELRDPLPGERRPPPSARERGAYLRDHVEVLTSTIQLPIIEKALAWIARQTTTLDALILISSDQKAAKPEHQAKDTRPYAQVIQRYLAQHPQWQAVIAADQIHLDLVIDDNPADFDTMREFYERELPKLKVRFGADQTYYLAISGGTPAMTGMLLFIGSDVFAKTAIPLYIPDSERAATRSLTASRRIYQQSLCHALLTAIKSYSYAAAATLIQDNVGDPVRVVDSDAAQQTIAALLTYAHQRLAFDFEAALATLEPVRSLLPHVREQLHQLYDETEWMLAHDEAKLREVFFGAEIKYRNGEYADLLGRIFRFHEGALRLLAQRWGAHFTADGRFLDQAWLRSVPALKAQLRNGGTGMVNRPLLRAVAGTLAPQGASTTLAYLDRIDPLASLRNQSVIAHSFTGISRQQLAQQFTGNTSADPRAADQIVATLGTICLDIQDQPITPNPFDMINALVATLLKRER